MKSLKSDPFFAIKHTKLAADASGGFGNAIVSREKKRLHEVPRKKNRPNFLYAAMITDKVSEKSFMV